MEEAEAGEEEAARPGVVAAVAVVEEEGEIVVDGKFFFVHSGQDMGPCIYVLVFRL